MVCPWDVRDSKQKGRCEYCKTKRKSWGHFGGHLFSRLTESAQRDSNVYNVLHRMMYGTVLHHGSQLNIHTMAIWCMCFFSCLHLNRCNNVLVFSVLEFSCESAAEQNILLLWRRFHFQLLDHDCNSTMSAHTYYYYNSTIGRKTVFNFFVLL